MSRPLRALLVPSHELGEDRLREIWRLRLEMLTLTRSEEQDWQEFRSAVVGPDRFVFVFVDPDNVAQGFFSIAMLPVEVGRRRLLLMFSKYFYFRRAYRGHPKTILAPWRLLPIAFRRFGPRSLHFVTTAYPQSYVSLTRTSGRTWSLRDPDAPGWAREALVAFAETFYPTTFDRVEGVVRGGNVADSEALAGSAEARRLLDHYEELNPHWRGGVTLPILFSVDARLVVTSARRSVRRWVRRG
ncbi:hypothetical protein [Nocardioides coralli]|uniref:hypothetical protein n=1 Tax=Nocardioides coralli TaxID=2872154 RepID=UPI001CA46D0D|nr:hypothetical protein [Nocardioides coralli]QZY30114.1 hypothetical protein K6T13_05380 [Nocardioides coralli]